MGLNSGRIGATMYPSPLSEPRFLHGIVGQEASQEDVEAQIPQASEGESPQAEMIPRMGRQLPAYSVSPLEGEVPA
jgi:hypothetical protein